MPVRTTACSYLKLVDTDRILLLEGFEFQNVHPS